MRQLLTQNFSHNVFEKYVIPENINLTIWNFVQRLTHYYITRGRKLLVEILANTWNTYRMGLTNSVQHNDFDSAILFSQCMNRSIPQISRPEIPVFPIAKGLTDDIALKQNKWYAVQFLLELLTMVSTGRRGCY